MSTPERKRSSIGEEVLFEEYMLRRAARSRIEAERETTDAVSLALGAGVSWARIGRLLGMPVSVVQHRHELEAERARGA